MDRAAKQADLDGAFRKSMDLLADGHLLEMQFHQRMLDGEAPQHVGKEGVERGVDGADRKACVRPPLDEVHGVDRRGRCVQHPVRMVDQDLARRREDDPAVVAHEEGGAEFLLQGDDLLAQRRLGDADALRRPGEVQLLRDGQEVAELAHVHWGSDAGQSSDGTKTSPAISRRAVRNTTASTAAPSRTVASTGRTPDACSIRMG